MGEVTPDSPADTRRHPQINVVAHQYLGVDGERSAEVRKQRDDGILRGICIRPSENACNACRYSPTTPKSIQARKRLPRSPFRRPPFARHRTPTRVSKRTAHAARHASTQSVLIRIRLAKKSRDSEVHAAIGDVAHKNDYGSRETQVATFID